MDYEKAKTIALKLANQYRLEMPFDDRVQECLLVWLEINGDDSMDQYVYVSMRNRLIDIWRGERLRRVTKLDWEPPDEREDPQQYLISQEEKQVIAIPKRTRVVRGFVRLMLENNLDLSKSCNDAGISYTKGISWWRRGKKIVKDMIESGDWKAEDVIAAV